jgi:hypothetical protein
MGSMFTSFFAFLVTMFGAAEKAASAANHLATWADEAAGTFADRARLERQHTINAILAEYQITELPKAPRESKVTPALPNTKRTAAPAP